MKYLLFLLLLLVTSCSPKAKNPGIHFFKKKIADPIPSSITDFKTLRYSNPNHGKGILSISFKIAPSDFQKIVKGWSRFDDISNVGLKKLYYDTFGKIEENKLDIYMTGVGMNIKVIITNKSHTNVIMELII